MKMKLLTKREWRMVQIMRGTALTGCPAQTCFDGKKVYFWPFGTQPSKNLLDKIAHKNPMRAAEGYLLYMEPRPRGSGQYTQPRPR